MSVPRADTLVFFGATGDLVYKKIFPALYAMERRGHLEVPVVGVARSDWTIEQFRARARAMGQACEHPQVGVEPGEAGREASASPAAIAICRATTISVS